MTAAAQRTPVSVLFEMCCQNDWTPEYDLTACQGASHDPTFTYQVKVEGITATASGASKRKAKHFAAKSALEQLLSKPESLKNGSFYFENTEVTLENLNEIVLEPSAEPVPMGNDSRNAVGELQEYCMKRKKLPPYYETCNESGPPHDKVFSIMCIVDRFTTYGEGKTKKLAKRVAAEEMYSLVLQNSDKEETISSDKEEKSKCGEENASNEENEICDEENPLNEVKASEEEEEKGNVLLPDPDSHLGEITDSINSLQTKSE